MAKRIKRKLTGKISTVDIRVHSLNGTEFKVKNEPLEKGLQKFMVVAEELFQLDLDKIRNESRSKRKQ